MKIVKKSLKFVFKIIFWVGGLAFLFAFQNNITPTLPPQLQVELGQLIEQKEALEKDKKVAETIVVLNKIQEIYESGNLWKEYIETTIDIAYNYGFLDKKQKVIHAQKAIHLYYTHHLKDELLLANAKMNKADALLKLNELDSVYTLYNQITPIFIKKKLWSEVVDCHFGTARQFYNVQNFDSAKVFINKALATINTFKTAKYETNLLSLRSVIHFREGDYQQAIITTLENVNLLESINNPSSIDKQNLADNYKNLVVFYNRKGETDRALSYYAKINEIFDFREAILFDKNLNHFNGISKILLLQNKYQEAIKNLRKSIKYNLNKFPTNKKLLQSRITAYYEMSSNWRKLEVQDSAALYAKKAIDVPLDYKKYIPYLRLAQTDLAKQDTKACLLNIDNSFKHYYSSKKSDPNYLIAIYNLAAKAYMLRKDYTQGLKSLQKSLVTNCSPFKDTSEIYLHPPLTDIAFPIAFLESLQIKAQLFTNLSTSEKDQKAALQTYQLAIQWIDTLQNSYVLEGAQLFWSKKYKEIYGEAIDLCYQFYKQNNDSQYLKIAFDIAEKSKALLLLEGLKDIEGKAIAGLPDSLIQKEKVLKIDLAFYEKSLQSATDKKQADRIQLYQSYLADTRLNLGRLKEQMEVDYPDYYQLKYANTTISIPEIQAKILDKQSTFVAYFLGTTNGYVFVISKNHQDFIRLADVATIQQKNATFLQQLKNPSAVQQNAKLAYQNYNQAAFALYQVILEAAAKNFPSNIKHLVIAPDDVLNNLPFEVLTTAIAPQPSMNFGSLPYLFDTYQIHYAYSANLLWKNQERQALLPTNTRCYAIAPPYKDKGKIEERGSLIAVRSGTVHLEGTGREIQGIANYFEGDYDSSNNASKANFLLNDHQYGLLHLAMHGEASGQDEAHLIFTNLSADTTSDNLLYHYEIANMDLTAQMAVLSACETGVGEYVQGEGVFSLARSFMYAGVPSLAMTLWKVNDGTTSILMPYFYKNLSEGMTKSTALHSAKKQFSQSAGLEFRHPYYWSGFVLLGDGGALKMENSWWLYGVGGVLTFLVGLFGYKSFVRRG